MLKAEMSLSMARTVSWCLSILIVDVFRRGVALGSEDV